MTPQAFYQALEDFGFSLSDQQKKQFADYLDLLLEWNNKINLTAITEPQDVYLKHFYDSLAPILYGLIPNTKVKLLDIGAGAGFPSIPMKILFPNLQVTIIDSLNKRINFLTHLSDNLGLDHIELYHGRAEDFGQDKAFRGQYELVTARAVARLNVLTELTIPFLKKQGLLLSLKASQMQDELLEAKSALTALGSQFIKEQAYLLPNGDERHILVIQKKLDTPNKFPRNPGVPNKKPL